MSAQIANPVTVEQNTRTCSEEVWRPVVGAEGYYEVSNRGRLRSIDRTIVRSDGMARRFSGRIIKPGVMPAGHLTVCLGLSGRRRTTQVHRLVAAAFLGPRPVSMEVRHRDGDPTNNDLRNLAYGTRPENMADRVAHGAYARRTHCRRRCRQCKADDDRRRRALGKGKS